MADEEGEPATEKVEELEREEGRERWEDGRGKRMGWRKIWEIGLKKKNSSNAGVNLVKMGTIRGCERG